MRKARLASPIRTHRTDSGKEGVVVLVVEQRDQLSHEIQRVPAHMRRVCKRTREDRLRLQAATRLFRGQFEGVKPDSFESGHKGQRHRGASSPWQLAKCVFIVVSW